MTREDHPTNRPAPEIVQYVQPADRLAVLDRLNELTTVANALASTDFPPAAFRGKPEAVLAALLFGAELGIPPTAALRSIDVIEGKPTLKAESMRALVLAAGHGLEILEASPERCEMVGRRRGSDHWSPPFVWTLERAQTAGLTHKDNSKKYPAAMLLARTSTDLCRAVFPDVTAGLASSEEASDYTDDPDRASLPARAVPPDVSPPLRLAPPVSDQPAPDRPPEPSPADHDLEPDAGYLRRKLHAEIADTFADVDTATRDGYRHALAALVSRKRRNGVPTVSSADLTSAEITMLFGRLAAIRLGNESCSFVGPGVLEYRSTGGHRYVVDLEADPVTVTYTRGDSGDPDPVTDGA